MVVVVIVAHHLRRRRRHGRLRILIMYTQRTQMAVMPCTTKVILLVSPLTHLRHHCHQIITILTPIRMNNVVLLIQRRRTLKQIIMHIMCQRKHVQNVTEVMTLSKVVVILSITIFLVYTIKVLLIGKVIKIVIITFVTKIET